MRGVALLEQWQQLMHQCDEAQRAAYEASRISITVVKRIDTQVKGFIVFPKRWGVERTLGLINRARRLSKSPSGDNLIHLNRL